MWRYSKGNALITKLQHVFLSKANAYIRMHIHLFIKAKHVHVCYLKALLTVLS